jgi:hypothetical protein
MPAAEEGQQDGVTVVRSRQIIGRTARDRTGQPLGRVVDLTIEAVTGRPPRVLAAVVTTRPWGRLLGYESPDEKGPWVLSRLARWIMRRHMRTVDWAQVAIDLDVQAPGGRGAA